MWGLKKVFADRTEIIDRSTETWKRIKSCLLLYAIHVSICIYIHICVTVHVYYLSYKVQRFVFGVADYPLSVWSLTPSIFSLSIRCENVSYYRDEANLCLFTWLYEVHIYVLEICESSSVLLCHYLSICNLNM